MAYEFYAVELRYAHTSHMLRETGSGGLFATVEIEAPDDRVLLITGIRNDQMVQDVVAVSSDVTLITQDLSAFVAPAGSKFGGLSSTAALRKGKRSVGLDLDSLRVGGNTNRRFDEVPLCIPAGGFFAVSAVGMSQTVDVEIEWVEISTVD